jgi:ABC-type Zn uptake system ZnuABC Zn-binding protein ZnuA
MVIDNALSLRNRHQIRLKYNKAAKGYQCVAGPPQSTSNWRTRSLASFVIRSALVCCLVWAGAGCSGHSASARTYIVTIAPLGLILQEVVGERAEVHVLLQPGVSPHTYEPRPSDVSVTETAIALLYVDDSLDGWAARLPGAHKIAVFQMVPEPLRLRWESGDADGHTHGDDDPHFWGDPLAVKAILSELVRELSSLDPEGAAGYEERADRFAAALDRLDVTLREQMAPVKGEPVAMFHSGWNYFLERYELEVVALVEPSPGKEATAQHIIHIAEIIRSRGVKAVFTEPQLARRPAEVVAEAGGVPVFEVDPLGGVPGRMTYEELLRANADVLIEALQ